MLPPITARDVHTVCPNDAPTATPIAFLWVASCMVITWEATDSEFSA